MNASKTKEENKEIVELLEISYKRGKAEALKEFKKFLVNQFYGDMNVNYDVLMIDFEKFEKQLGGTNGN